MIKTLLFSSAFLVSILCFGQDSWSTFTTTDGLPSNSIKAIDQDSQGTLWLATESGASSYNGSNFVNYTTADGLANNYVLTVFVDSQDNVWFGTMGGGVSMFNGTDWVSYSTADGLASSIVYAIYEDSNNKIWFGTTSGVSVYDGTWTSYNTSNGLTSNVVSSICEDVEGNMWIGMWTSGISIFDGSNWTTIEEADGLVYYQVTNIYRDSNDKMWIGTSDGLSVFTNATTWEANHLMADGMIDDWIQGIDTDSEGNIWLATYTNYLNNGGAILYNGTDWSNYSTSDGMASIEVTDVYVVNDQDIWFATRLGLNRFHVSTGTNSIQTQQDKINIYPNPATEQISIDSEPLNIRSISIIDITGKPVLHQKNKTQNVNISGLSKGVFIVQIQSDSGTYNKQLIIN